MVELDLVDSLQDIERYLNVPVVSVERTMALAEALLAVSPRFECKEMVEVSRELERELRVTRAFFLEQSPSYSALAEQREVAIEDLTDRLWLSLLKVLHGWKAFLHPGLDQLELEPKQKADLERARAKAERAMVLYESLFPAEELGFVVHPPFHEQAQVLEAFVRLCDDPDWADARELGGPHMLPLMRLVARQHQTLISSGAYPTRQGNALGLQRARLRRRIGRYNNVVMTLAEEGEPRELAMVNAMLAPVDALIDSLRASTASEGPEPPG